MYKHPFRKSFALLVLYSIIIIGIFVLQFRNESVVSKTIGLLSASFAQSQNQDGEISLKNSLQISFKGISFSADEVNPARLVLFSEEGEISKNLTLVSFEQRTPLSFTFHFADDAEDEVALTFAVSDADSDAALSINAELPQTASGLFLSYKPTSGFSVTEKTTTKLILNSKNLTYAFTASQIESKEIFLAAKNPISYYVAYDPSVEFSFASLDSEMDITQKTTYDANIKTIRESIVSSVAESIKTNQTLSEKSVIAYIAELASQGRYSEAIDYVPDSFKKGNKRTYLSAPYFDSLEAMYASLEMHTTNMAEMLANAVESSSLSIFSVDGIAEYIDTTGDTHEIRELLTLPAKLLNDETTAGQITVSAASGIISTYTALASLHSNLADSLFSAAEKCLEIIEANCALSDSTLTLTEKDSPVSDFLALTTGNALLQWGEFNNAHEFVQAGYALINSVLSENSLDAITLADIYPILISNPYYPHAKVLSRNSAATIWAWTCAPNISYSIQNNVATLSVNFPKNETNYAIISGIAPFTEIEIYGVSFHSDPRFEAYNSSGFIYRATKRALFLKSRHKSETEIVRLSFR